MKQKITILILAIAVILLIAFILSRPHYYYTNADAYVEKIGDYSQLQIEGANEAAQKMYLLSQMVNNTSFKTDEEGNLKLPQKDINRYVDEAIKKDKEAAEASDMHYKTYIEETTGMSFDEYEKTLNENAQDIVKHKIVVSYIKKSENIKVSKQDIKKFKKDYFETAGITEESFKREYGDSFEKLYGKDNIRYEILIQKVQDVLYEKVKAHD